MLFLCRQQKMYFPAKFPEMQTIVEVKTQTSLYCKDESTTFPFFWLDITKTVLQEEAYKFYFNKHNHLSRALEQPLLFLSQRE